MVRIFKEILLRAKKWFLTHKLAIVIVAILIISGAIGLDKVRVHSPPPGPLPANVVSSVNFRLYYPATLPSGYVLVPGSAKTEHGIVFYTLQNGNNKITISEQPLPQHPPDLKSISGFNVLTGDSGSIAFGTTDGSPAAILLTGNALVALNSTTSTPTTDVVKVAQKMRPL